MMYYRRSKENGRGQAGVSAAVIGLCLILFSFTVGISLLLGTYAQAKATVSGGANAKGDVPTNTPKSTPTPTVDEPQQKPEEIPWYLMLVNKDNPMQEGYLPTLANVEGSHKVDERIKESLCSMLKACRKQGLDPMICSSYRSNEDQESLFEAQLKKWKKQGMSYEDAFNKAKTTVAYPGTSEHQVGLAVDIVSVKNQVLDEKQESTKVYQWLKKHCAEYGFIVRYPDGKTDITGIIYEPWHFRYVGVEVAKEIMDKGITLEEYLQDYK